jgi:hypothetical protein
MEVNNPSVRVGEFEQALERLIQLTILYTTCGDNPELSEEKERYRVLTNESKDMVRMLFLRQRYTNPHEE